MIEAFLFSLGMIEIKFSGIIYPDLVIEASRDSAVLKSQNESLT